MVQEIHEVFANLFLLLAVLHIACVLIESRALGRNLVRPMTIGTKPPRGGARNVWPSCRASRGGSAPPLRDLC